MGIRERLADEYDEQTPGEALFFKNVSGTPAFRFGLIKKGWEFSDGKYIGKDPSGTFYYTDDLKKSLSENTPTKADYFITEVEEGGKFYAHIKFYKPNSTTAMLGEFAARDVHRQVRDSGLKDKTGRSGLWEKVNYSFSTATVNKSGTEFTVTSPTLRKKATFNCDTKGQLHNSAVQNIGGNLVIKDIVKINEAKTVRWTPDNLVFYPNTNSTALSGFFSVTNENIPNQLGADDRKDIEFENSVTWTNIN